MDLPLLHIPYYCTPSTTHHTAFYNPLHTTKKHTKHICVSGSKMAQDVGVKYPSLSTPVSSTILSSTLVSSTTLSSTLVLSTTLSSTLVSSTTLSSTLVSSTTLSSTPVSSTVVSSTPHFYFNLLLFAALLLNLSRV